MTDADQGHGIVIRAWLGEPEAAGESTARWFAVAEAVPERLARATVAGGELPDTAGARAAHVAGAWPVETAAAASEEDAVLEAVRRLLGRGLEPKRG